MIRKLRTERDNQQWMLDLALNMRGRVQNFERDYLEVPQGKARAQLPDAAQGLARVRRRTRKTRQEGAA